MTIKRTSDASQKLEDLVPNTIEVIDELDGLEGLEVDPNKIYWLKGTPESTRKSLLMLYEEPIQGNYFYEITPYESRFEVVFDLAEKVMSSRGMGAGHIALDTLSELKYLKERKNVALETTKPTHWTVSDQTHLYFTMIMAYVKDHDAQNMDIVLVGKDINADAARKILTANYVRHNFTDQIAAFARELQ